MSCSASFLLEVWRDHSKIRVHTHCLRKDGGAWEG
jgi:hypothetical protein